MEAIDKILFKNMDIRRKLCATMTSWQGLVYILVHISIAHKGHLEGVRMEMFISPIYIWGQS